MKMPGKDVGGADLGAAHLMPSRQRGSGDLGNPGDNIFLL